MKTHGMSYTKIYKIWTSMLMRCINPKDKGYHNYGGRGIKVCKRWHKFENFYADMGDRPEGLALERIDNNGNYEPSNCKWATYKENLMNKRNNRYLTFKGKTKSIRRWSEELGINRNTLYRRLFYGWTIERALTL